MISVRPDFPILNTQVNGKTLVYLDNAATTLKPKSVVDRISQYYLYESSNVHRGAHYLSDLGTQNYEKARKAVQHFLNASSEAEILFNKGTTDALNFIAHTYGEQRLREGDEVLISDVEHHSNIVPWQIVAQKKGFKIKTFSVGSSQEETLENFKKALSPKTKISSFVHISNALGIILPVRELCEVAQKKDIVTIVDGAQAVAHLPIDVQSLGCDFYVFSAHKIYGPTGFGVVYGRSDLLSKLKPYQGGGGIIDKVTLEETTYIEAPYCFEPGTPHIAGAIGLHSAIDYLQKVGMNQVKEHEDLLTQDALDRLQEIPDVEIYKKEYPRSSIVSFNISGIHSSDLGSLLDQYGVAVRTGHHCTQPLMASLGVSGTARASFAIYNTIEENKYFIESLQKTIKMLKV